MYLCICMRTYIKDKIQKDQLRRPLLYRNQVSFKYDKKCHTVNLRATPKHLEVYIERERIKNVKQRFTMMFVKFFRRGSQMYTRRYSKMSHHPLIYFNSTVIFQNVKMKFFILLRLTVKILQFPVKC